MPIPLGILAAAGRSQAPAGAFQLLESTVLTGSQASVEFTNLTTKYAATYQHLQLRIVALSGQANWARIRLNNDTTAANYRSHALTGNGSTVASSNFNGTTNGADFQFLTGSTIPSPSVIDILDPFETKNKTLRSLTGLIGTDVGLTSGLYMNTASLTEISLRHPSSTFSQFSRFSLYGIKATA
jgi:hypothetical protein